MPNNTNAAREAAWNQSPTYYRICDGNEPDPCRAEADWKSGFDAGAAREEWVAVETRLPEPGARVDVSVHHPDGTDDVEYDVGWNGRQWWNADYDGPIEEDGDVVTAWMPRRPMRPYGGKDA